jgi:hypothetical protein
MKLRTKNGRLTAYAFACGYVEQKHDDATNASTSLWVEHGAPHVRTITRDTAGNITSRDWQAFDQGQLAEARKAFNKKPGEIFNA